MKADSGVNGVSAPKQYFSWALVLIELEYI